MYPIVKFSILTVILGTLSSCAWLSRDDQTQYSLANLKNNAKEYNGSEVFRDEETAVGTQIVNCIIHANGNKKFSKNFQFHFDLEQLYSSNWAERVSIGEGLEVYTNLWSFREYTLGIQNTRRPASTESRIIETKGVWSKAHEKTVTDLAKIKFQAKLFYHSEQQSYEVICPSY